MRERANTAGGTLSTACSFEKIDAVLKKVKDADGLAYYYMFMARYVGLKTSEIAFLDSGSFCNEFVCANGRRGKRYVHVSLDVCKEGLRLFQTYCTSYRDPKSISRYISGVSSAEGITLSYLRNVWREERKLTGAEGWQISRDLGVSRTNPSTFNLICPLLNSGIAFSAKFPAKWSEEEEVNSLGEKSEKHTS